LEEISAVKRQLNPGKTASRKKRKTEFILSTETNSTSSSDEGELQEFFLLAFVNLFVLAKLS
jgi:hypothetical protein